MMELPELPQIEVLHEVRDFACPSCRTMIRHSPPIKLGHTTESMRAYGAACAAAALEAAAKVCDGMNESEDWYALVVCAAAIRALAAKQESK
jgi:hypothetical protein